MTEAARRHEPIRPSRADARFGAAGALLIALLLAAGVSRGEGGAAVAVPPRSEAPAATGICAVCGGRVGPDAPASRVRGSWVRLCSAACGDKFSAEPDRYFSQFLPASAFLFDDDYEERSPLSPPVFWIAVYVLSGIVSAGVLGHVAVARGKPRFAWFLAGLAGSVAALVILLPRARGIAPAVRGLGKIEATAAPAACGACGAYAHPSAARCPRCGAPLSPALESEAHRAGDATAHRETPR
ncbi:MAG: hypothetical protein ACKVU1_08850 [bacterium]